MPSTRRLRWLIVGQTAGKTDVLTLNDDGRRVLPVFSFLEEAEMYARLQVGDPRWRPRTFSAGEIVSLLYGPLADVTSVALDPLPEVCNRTALRLVRLGRRPFVRALVREGREGVARRGYRAPTEVLGRGPAYASHAPRAAARGTAPDPSSMWPHARG